MNTYSAAKIKVLQSHIARDLIELNDIWVRMTAATPEYWRDGSIKWGFHDHYRIECLEERIARYTAELTARRQAA